MGCQSSKENPDSCEVSHSLQKLIDLNSVHSLSKFCVESKIIENINTIIITSGSLKTNPLGYALTKGKVDSFKYIYTRLGALINDMEEIFNAQGYRSIDLLCLQGHLPMIKFYLPVYISIFLDSPMPPKDAQDTLSFTSSFSLPNFSSFIYTPIQFACYSENLNLIKFFVEYFKSQPVPSLFDLNYQNEISGENCALISCKLGNYKLMKFLYEECQADFSVLNKRDENALLVLAAASHKVDYCDYLMCFRYLINVVKIDPRYKHEEIVLLMDDSQMLEMYFEALEPYGVFPDKDRLEKMNMLKFEQVDSKNEDFSNFAINSDKVSWVSTVKNDELTDTSQFSGISALIKNN